MVLQHLIECLIDLVEGTLARGPHIWVVSVVTRGIDHGLRPTLKVLLGCVVKTDHVSEGFRCEWGREVPDQVRARAFLDEFFELFFREVAVHAGPDSPHIAGFERWLPCSSLDVVFRVILAQHRVPHRADLQRPFFVGGIGFLVVFRCADSAVGRDEVATNCGYPMHAAFCA